MSSERISLIRSRTSEKTVPVFSIATLRQYCLVTAPIIADCTLKMCPGILMSDAPIQMRRQINATFGIEKYDPETREQVASCGFNIEDNVLVIKNTPHGKRPDDFTLVAVKNRLTTSDFRIEMMQVMLDIAKNLKLQGVMGFPIVEQNVPVPKRIYRAVNELFESFGFDLISDTKPYYYYNLVAGYTE